MKLVFVYIDNLNYQKKLLLRKNGKCSQDVPAVVSKEFPPNQGEAPGFDKKVMVMLTSDGSVPGCSGDWEQCIFHGDIDCVECDLVCELEQWTKLWFRGLYHRVEAPSLDFLTKLRREVLARDCSTILGKCIIFLFASSGDKFKLTERLRYSHFVVDSSIEYAGIFHYGLDIKSLKQQAQGKDNAYVFVAQSEPIRFDWYNCLLYGDIERTQLPRHWLRIESFLLLGAQQRAFGSKRCVASKWKSFFFGWHPFLKVKGLC